MREPPIVRMLPDERRLHLHDGPIDLIVEAFGSRTEICAAYEAAARRFLTILDELCAELPLLRSPAGTNEVTARGVVARRMADAVGPFAPQHFITPMAAILLSISSPVNPSRLA